MRRAFEDAAEALRTAAALDCRTLVVYSGPRAGHTSSHARRLVAGALTQLADQAQCVRRHAGDRAHASRLCRPVDVSYHARRCAGAVGSVASPQVKMVLDTYHVGQEEGLIERLGTIVPQVAIVQLGDARRPPTGEQNRCRLGEGVVPLAEITATLKAAGYRRLLRRRVARRRVGSRRLCVVAGTRENGVCGAGRTFQVISVMLNVTPNSRIPLREFTFTFARSGGPGGQNVNKVNTKALLRWPSRPVPACRSWCGSGW